MPLQKILTAALLALLVLANPGQADPKARLAVSPDRYIIDFDAAGGDTQSLMVKNLAAEPLTVKVTVANWVLNDNNMLQEIPPQPDSLDQWMVINPLTATIPPDTPQTFRWAILPRQQPEPGEYRAVIFIEEVLAEREKKEGRASIRMKMRFGIPVYAQFGEPADNAQVRSIGTGPTSNTILLELANQGNRHARLQGTYSIWPSSEFPGSEAALAQMAKSDDENTPIVKMQDVVLLPGNERQVTLEPVLPGPGEYTLQFDASFGDEPVTNTVQLRSMD